MLFNSYAFLFGFMPVLLAGYWVAGRIGGSAPIAWLSLGSIFFYAYWTPAFLILLISSAVFNYGFGHLIGTAKTEQRKKWAFRIGIAGNLLTLAFFKYLGPTATVLNEQGATWIPPLSIVLPLGISFWTFTQIGYLVDRRDGLASELKPLHYSLFVNFFPHLIAGPILHVREIGPQILDPMVARLRASTFAPGLAIFAIGLAKKVLIADPLSPVVDGAYAHAGSVDIMTAWIAVLSYSMQLYFDFSGYTDMAIGLAGMVGFKFPLNFNSPYKSRGVIEYWQRWHMTLTRYLGLLLFNPAAMIVTRRRLARGQKVSSKALKDVRAFATMLAVPTFYTMFLAGIWHGAGLQYLIFGLLQAVYLTINHAWRIYGPQRPKHVAPTRLAIVLSVAITYLAAVLSQTFFRSTSCANALALIGSAFGANGLMLPYRLQPYLRAHATDFVSFGPAPDKFSLGLLFFAMVLVWATPNSQQILGKYAPVLTFGDEGGMKWLRWQPNWIWALIVAVLFWLALFNLNQATTFIYFQF